MEPPGTVEAWINPLAFLEVDEPWASHMPNPAGNGGVTADQILSFLCPPGTPSDRASVVERYRQISSEPVRLFAAPAEPRILDKLVWPLRNAKAAYALGNYLGVVALCGMVAEMVAVLFWKSAEPQISGIPMTIEDETALFGSSFEKLGQDRRVRVLRAHRLITLDVARSFDTIRTVRRRYLHLWSQGHDHVSAEAIECYLAAVGLVVEVIGQEVKDGMLVLQPRLLRYLAREGIYTAHNGSQPT